MNNRKILIVGGDSSLSKELIKFFDDNFIGYKATSRRLNPDKGFIFLDLSQPNSFHALTGLNFSTVILAASICSIDECEGDKQYTSLVNVKNTFTLISVLKKVCPDIRVIMLSTDMVLDGALAWPTQITIKAPLTEYGRQKSELEDKLIDNYNNIKILRFGKILEKDLPLFNEWACKLKTGKKIIAFNDLIFAPISTDYSIKAIMMAIESSNISNEIYHVNSGVDITYCDAALWLAKNLRVSSELVEGIGVHQVFPSKVLPKRMALGNNLNIVSTLKGIEAFEVFLK